MHPLTKALLSAWDLRPEILAVLIPLGILYTLGWLRLRKQSANRKLATWPRLVAYLSGLSIIAIVLMSPIDRLGGQLLFMHMIQHKLPVMFAAPLLWLAEPFPIILWSLPWSWRYRIGGLFTRNSVVRRVLAAITRPGVTWLVFIAVYLGWHDSTVYNAALSYDWVHDIQHISFVLVALLYWYPIIGAAPRLNRRLPSWGKIIYLIGTVPPNMALGVSIAFASEVIYTYYNSVPRLWGFTVMQDQQIGGAIMWIPGSMMFIMVALFVLGRLFYYGDEKSASRRNSEADTTGAPGREVRARRSRSNQGTAQRTMSRVTNVESTNTL
jgi:putative membrane protein